MGRDKDRIEIREQVEVSLVIYLCNNIKSKKATLQGKYNYSSVFSEPPFLIYIYMAFHHQKDAIQHLHFVFPFTAISDELTLEIN